MIHAYHVEPCHSLNNDQRARMRRAIMDIEIATIPYGNPSGYRIFDAYITTNPPTSVTAADGFIIRSSTPPPTKPQQRHTWWRRWRDR